MLDITKDIQLYRETARHVWNSCLAGRMGDASGGALEAFDRICEELFQALVLTPHDVDEPVEQMNVQGFRCLRVIPVIAEGTPVLVNRKVPACPYWDDPLAVVKPDKVELGFIGFFDWDAYAPSIDLRYLRAYILSCSETPGATGKEALIDFSHAKVILLRGGETSPV